MDFLVLAFSDLFTWPGAEIVRSWLFLDESTRENESIPFFHFPLSSMLFFIHFLNTNVLFLIPPFILFSIVLFLNKHSFSLIINFLLFSNLLYMFTDYFFLFIIIFFFFFFFFFVSLSFSFFFNFVENIFLILFSFLIANSSWNTLYNYSKSMFMYHQNFIFSFGFIYLKILYDIMFQNNQFVQD